MRGALAMNGEVPSVGRYHLTMKYLRFQSLASPCGLFRWLHLIAILFALSCTGSALAQAGDQEDLDRRRELRDQLRDQLRAERHRWFEERWLRRQRPSREMDSGGGGAEGRTDWRPDGGADEIGSDRLRRRPIELPDRRNAEFSAERLTDAPSGAVHEAHRTRSMKHLPGHPDGPVPRLSPEERLELRRLLYEAAQARRERAREISR